MTKKKNGARERQRLHTSPCREVNKLLLLLLVTVLMVTLVTSGCRRSPEKKVVPPTLIGVSWGEGPEDAAELIRKSLTAREKEDNVRVIWKDSGSEPSRQEKDITELLSRQVKILLVRFVDPEGAAGLARRIEARKVPLLVVGELPEGVPADGFIGPDFSRVGAIIATYLVNHLTGKDRSQVLLLQERPAGPAALNLASALAFGLQEVAPALTLLRQAEPELDERKAAQEIKNLVGGGGKAAQSLGAVVLGSDRLFKSVLEELKLAALADEVLLVSVGGGKEAAQALAAGDLKAEIDLRPDLLGREAYRAAMDLTRTGRWDYEFLSRADNRDIPAKFIPIRLVTSKETYLLEQRWGKPREGEGQKEDARQQQGGGDQGSSGKEDQKNMNDQQSDKSSGNQGGSSSSDSGGAKGGTKTKLLVKTRDGKTMEIEIDGEVQSVQLQRAVSPAEQGGSDQ